jgi:hypothetical protein
MVGCWLVRGTASFANRIDKAAAPRPSIGIVEKCSNAGRLFLVYHQQLARPGIASRTLPRRNGRLLIEVCGRIIAILLGEMVRWTGVQGAGAAWGKGDQRPFP